jgi:hypothetical protein
MTLKLRLDVRMARAVVVAAAVGAIGIIPAVPAMAGTSTSPKNGEVHFDCNSQAVAGSLTDGNSSDQFIGAKAACPWKVREHSGGYGAATAVSFTFREGSTAAQSTNNQYYFALPVAIDPLKVAIHNETVAGHDGGAAPGDCLARANSATTGYEHPSSISVDWANQSFSMVVPTAALGTDVVEYCFDTSIDIGFPLTPTQGPQHVSKYVVFYAEPGGTDKSPVFGVNAWADLVQPRSPSPGNHETSSFMHFFGHSGGLTVDLSQAGEGVMGPGLPDTPYDVVLMGNKGSTYSLTAESATGVGDPRVSITCFSGCTAPNANNLEEVHAVFSVSCGVLDHFVIVAKNTGSKTKDIAEVNGVTAFTVSAKACPTAASAPAAVIPALPSAGHPLMPVQYDWMLLLLIPAIGVLGWISVKPD